MAASVSEDGETAFAALCFAVGLNPVNGAFFNGLLNHLTGHQNPRHEDAMAAPLAVPALALGCGGGGGVGHDSGQPSLGLRASQELGHLGVEEPVDLHDRLTLLVVIITVTLNSNSNRVL